MYQMMFGYKIMNRPSYLLPSTVIAYNETTQITVQMAREAVDHALDYLAKRNLTKGDYKKAKIVFEAFKLILNNKTPHCYSKEEAKCAIDVLEEIINENTTSEAEKQNNANWASLLRFLISAW